MSPGSRWARQNYTQSCTLDGHDSVGLSIYQLPGTNALDVADRVRAKMEELKKRFPDGVDYVIGYDTTPYIRESIREVFKTLRDAVILVGLVVLVFLQDWRTMILPMIDVPVSLIGTFAVMAVLGFSLNNLTLFGLVLAIGIVVDDAIVVLENTERMLGLGYDARTATIKAMEEITGPIIAITLALSSVFVPCCFLSGITGQFFQQFAVTIAVSTIISAVNALTMTPSRAVIIFKTQEGQGGHGGHLKREALPWWVFAILGGLPDRPAGRALRGGAARPADAGRGRRGRRRVRLADLELRGGIRPRDDRGRPGGQADHPAGQRRAGLAVPRLQPAVRRGDRGLRLDGRQAAAVERAGAPGLRRPAGPDRLDARQGTQGLHPAAGPGPADPERPAPRLGVAPADRGGHGPGRRDLPWRRRAWRTRSPWRGCRSSSRPPRRTWARCSSCSTRSTSGRSPS